MLRHSVASDRWMVNVVTSDFVSLVEPDVPQAVNKKLKTKTMDTASTPIFHVLLLLFISYLSFYIDNRGHSTTKDQDLDSPPLA